MWMLAMDELRQAARDHSRLTRINRAVTANTPDLWMFGLAPAPEYLQPFASELLELFQHQAQSILTQVQELLKARLDVAQRQAQRYLGHVRDTYQDLHNQDYNLAERRLLGIVTHYRIRERDNQSRISIDEETRRPKTTDQWKDALARRRTPTEAQTSRSRKRNRSRSNSRSKSRGRSPAAGPSTSNTSNRGGLSTRGSDRGGPRGGPRGGRSRNNSRRNQRDHQDDSIDAQVIIDWFRQQQRRKRR